MKNNRTTFQGIINMPPDLHPTRAPLSATPSPLPSARLHWRSPTGIEPAPRLCRPGAINLRSSAFICGSFFAEASWNKDSDRIDRMDKIKPSANPVNPVHPIHSSFSAAPDINTTKFIKSIDLSLRPLRSLRWCIC